MTSTTDDQVLRDKLKSALWFQIGKIVDEESLNLRVNATPQFIGSLTELVWAQIGKLVFLNTPSSCAIADDDLETAAVDLESFAKHAGRTTVKTDDVMLLTRRNDGLEQILKKAMEDLKKENRKRK